MNPSQRISSSTFLPARDSDSASIRPRNRRLANTKGDDGESSSSCSSSQTPSRGTSTPIPAAHIGSVTGRNDSRTEVAWSRANTNNRGTTGGGLLGGGWTPSWASVQELASSIISTGELLINGEPHRPQTRDGSQTWRGGKRSNAKKDNWGPEPPSETRPRSSDIAAGSLAKREAKLKAMKTASVLESHEGVNGGLDFAGKFKRRSSDEELRGKVANEEAEEHLVYVHHVQPTDTYAGLVLKYRCREDAFRKANGLWSRDGVQVRKLLLMPVDACEVRGRPCEPPRDPNAKVDLLAKTPDTSDPWGREDAQEGFFASSTNGNNSASEQQSKSGENDWPWTHVRWVSIDSHPHPVEVARVSRKVLGYFPPRRKKSIHTMSTSSTPRGSFDFPSFTLSQPGPESPRRAFSSRRPSLLSSRSQIASSQQSGLPPLSAPGSHSNVQGHDSDPRPAWMRRPGGVGSLGMNVRVPGPQKDYLNNWANKHLPGLNIDSLPSMSVMGSETARFGFTIVDDSAPPAIVESPFREGQDATAASRHGSGLDKAAAAVETWLRGAFERAKSGNVTPILGPRRGGGGVGPGQSGDIAQGDLIELENAASDDGRVWHDSTWDAGGLLGSLPVSAQGASGSNGMSGEAGVRARGSTALQGRKKAD